VDEGNGGTAATQPQHAYALGRAARRQSIPSTHTAYQPKIDHSDCSVVGLEALIHLRRLPVDEIKIDKSFIIDID
jgi:sensor c-di-GMP phosphodiesterase-like protein